MTRHPVQRQLWPGVEVGVLLLLLVPSFFFAAVPAEERQIGFVDVAVSAILRDLGLLALVLYWLWRGGEPLRTIGLNSANFGREVLVGGALFIPFLLLVGVIRFGVDALGLPGAEQVPEFLIPEGGGQIALALIFLIVVAVAEEALFRGYLIHRLRQLTGSVAAAVLLSSGLFALGHGYQGIAGLITVGLLGLVLAGVYLWRGSLTAPITLHFLQNATGILVAPLLLGK